MPMGSFCCGVKLRFSSHNNQIKIISSHLKLSMLNVPQPQQKKIIYVFLTVDHASTVS